MFNRIFTLALIILALSGCTSQQERLGNWAQANGSKIEVIQTSQFPIQTVTPANLVVGERLTVLIEGDGHAWATSTQPSTDPTPHTLSLAKLTVDSRRGVYMARPCQYVMNQGCDKSMWTDARFSRAAVSSMNEVINKLKARYHASSIELIGYSGGAAVALILAAERDDVTQLQTIAGNVDPAAWVALNGLSPLTGSLSTLANPQKLSGIPQRHFVGSGDTVIPRILTEGFVRKISSRCAEVVDVFGSHASIVSRLNGAELNHLISCK